MVLLQTPVDELQPPSPSPTPSPTPSPKSRKSRGTSPQRSKRRFFSFGKKDKEKDKDKRRHSSSQSDLAKDDKSHTLPAKPKDTLQVPGTKTARSASAGELSLNNRHEGRSDTSSLRSTNSRGSLLSYTPNEYSTLVIETFENGRIKNKYSPPPPRRRSFSLGRSRSRSRDRRYDHDDSSVISEPSSETKDSLKSDPTTPSSPASQSGPQFEQGQSSAEADSLFVQHSAGYTMVESAPPQSLLYQQVSSSPQSAASEAYYLADDSNPFMRSDDHRTL
ncbi:uncharacterized protein [Ptychodera flava]|uniref:uncharacterized protein n=1 Tax=Ptychodera flava TaxID=63121 RepID=UPI00396A74E2